MNPNYSIVTNFFIDDDESLQRMKDSLTSFKNAKSEMWIINIRGNYKYQASPDETFDIYYNDSKYFKIILFAKAELQVC